VIRDDNALFEINSDSTFGRRGWALCGNAGSESKMRDASQSTGFTPVNGHRQLERRCPDLIASAKLCRLALGRRIMHWSGHRPQ